jgi:hypothetical protein
MPSPGSADALEAPVATQTSIPAANELIPELQTEFAHPTRLLLAGGAQGKRMALPNARILIHQLWGGFEGEAGSGPALTTAYAATTVSTRARGDGSFLPALVQARPNRPSPPERTGSNR